MNGDVEQASLGGLTVGPEGEPLAVFVSKHGKIMRFDRAADGGLLVTIGERQPAEFDRFQTQAIAAACGALRTSGIE